MRFYFCSGCGKAFRHRECKKQGQHGILYRLACPDCGLQVRLSSVPVLVLGLVILVVSILLIRIGVEGLPLVGTVGAVVGAGVCVAALVRMRSARRSSAQKP